MNAALTSTVPLAMPALDASTALLGLMPTPAVRTSATRTSWLPSWLGGRRTRRRVGAAVPLFLATTLAVTANLTGMVEEAPTRDKPIAPKPKPPVADRGKTVREAIADASRAAAAALHLRSTVSPPALYTVVTGDTLPEIARRYGLATASLLALNGLSWSSGIHPGQVLKLTAAGPVVEAPPPAPPVPVEQRHAVEPGESLSAIAARYGVDLAALLSANGFSAGSIIYPGQLVIIPTGAPAQDGGESAAPVAEPVEEPAAEPVEEPVEEPAADPGTVPAADPDGGAVWIDEEQWGNAAIVVEVGRSMGVPEYGIVVALATAAQESSLRNLDHGHLDSVGLFQQRPSQGWGTVDELTDPYEAARRFYGGPGVPTMGLLDVADWESMSVAEAAQSVQRSAYPDAYAQWEQSARAWLAGL